MAMKSRTNKPNEELQEPLAIEEENEYKIASNDINSRQQVHIIEQKHYKPITVNNQSNDSKLVNLLKQYDLYDDLYKLLHDNKIDLDMLQNDVKQNEIDQFCDEYKFEFKNKLKFRKLMRIIKQPNITNKDQLIYNSVHRNSSSLVVVDGNDFSQPSPKMHVINNETAYSMTSVMSIQTLIVHNNDDIKRREDDIMKVTLIGDASVGKSSIVRQYVDNEYTHYTETTIGAEFKSKTEILMDGTAMKLDIWDTAGEEKFDSISRSFYRKANAVLVCYDIGSKESLINCDKTWRAKIDEMCDDDIIVVLVGCKNDRKREVTKNDAITMINQEEWKKYNTQWCECSAKNNLHIKYVFVCAAQLVLQKRKRNKDYLRLRELQKSKNIDLNNAIYPKQANKCCSFSSK